MVRSALTAAKSSWLGAAILCALSCSKALSEPGCLLPPTLPYRVLQRDSHIAEMTVAETLAYASESLGPGLAEGACTHALHCKELVAC